MSEIAKGYTCKTCGKFNEFSAYVYSHWYETLTHICDCQAKHDIRRGIAVQISKGKKPPKEML